MSKILPSSANIRQQVLNYCDDSRKIADASLSTAAASLGFREIFEISLSAHTVLGGLMIGLRPRLSAARTIAVRIPFLVGSGQSSAADAELRRFVELVLWAIYFTDHPIEWKDFANTSTGGFAQDPRKPISYAAHRELAFYIGYAIEMMTAEPSGLGIAAVENIKQAVRKLNAAVHAGRLARATGRIPPYDPMTEIAMRDFAKVQRLVFANCSLLLAAYRRSRFNHLKAMPRAYFDWLVGARVRRDVRKGPFGLT